MNMAMPLPRNGVSPVILPDELAARLRAGKAPRMIDVRETGEFAAEHIPGAENIPLSRFTALFRTLPKNEELVLVCRSGNRSGMAQQFLQAQGYTATRNLVDGLLGWDGPTAAGK